MDYSTPGISTIESVRGGVGSYLCHIYDSTLPKTPFSAVHDTNLLPDHILVLKVYSNADALLSAVLKSI